MKELTVGQWLGIENRIDRLTHHGYGWKMTDKTGATYRQDEFPDGLQVADEARDCSGEPRTPWPKEAAK